MQCIVGSLYAVYTAAIFLALCKIMCVSHKIRNCGMALPVIYNRKIVRIVPLGWLAPRTNKYLIARIINTQYIDCVHFSESEISAGHWALSDQLCEWANQ